MLGNTAWMSWLAVDEKYQRQGIGTLMVKEFVSAFPNHRHASWIRDMDVYNVIERALGKTLEEDQDGFTVF